MQRQIVSQISYKSPPDPLTARSGLFGPFIVGGVWDVIDPEALSGACTQPPRGSMRVMEIYRKPAKNNRFSTFFSVMAD